MTGVEAGFLLLTSQLGDPERKPLTPSQFRILAGRVGMGHLSDGRREMTIADLAALGYGGEMAARILRLLSDETQLHRYLRGGEKRGCAPLTRATPGYPLMVRKRLGLDSPGCLWYRGDRELLENTHIALVGSRVLREENRKFAAEAGRQAALQGYTLVSGNAPGADQTAQEACLAAGGSVICVVATPLQALPIRPGVLYLAEDGYDLPFSAQRALRRNRIIHSMVQTTLVAQSSLEKGGTWDGCMRNLRFHWSGVCCYRDGSEASVRLEQLGAMLIETKQLQNLAALRENVAGFLSEP